MPPRIDDPTLLHTSIYGLPLTPIVSSWSIEEDESGTYIVPFAPTRHLVSPEKGFVGVEFRLYFDLAKTEPDSMKRRDHCFLRSGLEWKNAKATEVSLS
ncbi:MAG TPA: hypothetical protein VHC20_05200 [Candidatus Paceibacterota bacterium]|nr:hypothetical protein [Candidatus Paceibacterota bacterium]